MIQAPSDVRAAVSSGTGVVEVETFDLDGAAGWLRVESSGICGTDVQLNVRGLQAPAVLGHHVIGTIEHLDDEFAELLGVAPGERVAVEEYIGCGHCQECMAGAYRFCPQADLWTGGERVGMLPTRVRTGLHGGNAEFMELSARHALHPVPAALSPDLAAWALPLANAIEWVMLVGGACRGSRVAIIGPGYHGFACAAAARHAGAAEVHLFGLERDAERLRVAEGLRVHTHVGAHVGGVPELDIVVDTVGSTRTTALATTLLARHGTLVLAGISGGTELDVDATAVVRRLLTIRGVRGRSPEAVGLSIRALDQGMTGLGVIPTHRIGLDEVGSMLTKLRSGSGPATPHVIVDPWLTSRTGPRPAEFQEVSS